MAKQEDPKPAVRVPEVEAKRPRSRSVDSDRVAELERKVAELSEDIALDEDQERLLSALAPHTRDAVAELMRAAKRHG